ncbi:MAG: FAD:protein FMN transferase, partial [Flavobacteriaceae bacterium]
FSGEAFGTTYNMVILAEETPELIHALDSLIHSVNRSLSTYDPTSAISRINDGEQGVVVDQMFADVFHVSQRVYLDTEGFFDPTVGPLVNAWGFGPESVSLDRESIADSLRQLVGFDQVILDKQYHVSFQKKGMYLDFNAIAKGYAIDRMGNMLDRRGYTDYLIEVGGEVLVKGKNTIKNSPWRIGIDDPSSEDRSQPIRTITLTQGAMASSGNYRKFVLDSVTGQKFVHTINPITGKAQPSSTLAVSVIAPDCATADAYATAFMAMGLERTQAWVNRQQCTGAVDTCLDVFAVYAAPDGSLLTWETPGFSKR